MAKNNPLFVDSTLLHGDRIGTQIELNRILVYDDESVLVVVTNHLGETQQVAMKCGEEGGYQARVWLSHQKSITCRFVVERAGKILYQSATYQARAQYAMIQEWEPCFVEPRAALPPPEARKANPSSAPSPSLPNQRPLANDYTRGVASLIEKWGL